MYNGIGLQTPRGSGTNGYIQTNKFLVRPRTGKVAHNTRGFEPEQGTGGISRKANKDILDHDRKRQLHLKLVVLEDKLIEQGYTDAEIAQKLEEARNTLEAAAASDETGGPSAILVSGAKYSDTQSHQVAARKEKQMETLREALGIRSSEPNEQSTEGIDDGPQSDQNNGQSDDNTWIEKREHSFLDRDYSRKKHGVGSLKVVKDEMKEHKKKERDDSSDTDDSSKHAEVTKKKKHHKVGREKKHHKVGRESVDEDDIESDMCRKSKSSKKHKKSRKYDTGSDDSSGSDESKSLKKHNKKSRKYDSESDDSPTSSDDTDSDQGKKENRRKNITSKRRYDTNSDDSSSGNDTDNDDEEVGRKNNSLPKKIQDQHKASSKTEIDDSKLEDRWKSEDTHEKSRRFQSQDDENKRENRTNKDYEARGRHIGDDVDRKIGRHHRVGEEDNDGRQRKDKEDRSRSRARGGKEEERSRGQDDRNNEGHRREKNYRRDEDGIGRKYHRDEEAHDDRYGQHGKFVEQEHGRRRGRDEEEKLGGKSQERDNGQHGKFVEQEHGRRRGRDEEEKLGGKSQERDKQMNYSKRARYGDSRSNDRKRYEDDKHVDTRGLNTGTEATVY